MVLRHGQLYCIGTLCHGICNLQNRTLRAPSFSEIPTLGCCQSAQVGIASCHAVPSCEEQSNRISSSFCNYLPSRMGTSTVGLKVVFNILEKGSSQKKGQAPPFLALFRRFSAHELPRRLVWSPSALLFQISGTAAWAGPAWPARVLQPKAKS